MLMANAAFVTRWIVWLGSSYFIIILGSLVLCMLVNLTLPLWSSHVVFMRYLQPYVAELLPRQFGNLNKIKMEATGSGQSFNLTVTYCFFCIFVVKAGHGHNLNCKEMNLKGPKITGKVVSGAYHFTRLTVVAIHCWIKQLNYLYYWVSITNNQVMFASCSLEPWCTTSL